LIHTKITNQFLLESKGETIHTHNNFFEQTLSTNLPLIKKELYYPATPYTVPTNSSVFSRKKKYE
jgi:hypothetical protein